MFALDVYGHDGKPLNVEQIYQQLLKVVEESQQCVPPLGLLTMEGRDNWSKQYHKLVKGHYLWKFQIIYPINVLTYTCVLLFTTTDVENLGHGIQ